jgi:hypothetical protein
MEREARLQDILNLSKTSSFRFSSKGALLPMSFRVPRKEPPNRAPAKRDAPFSEPSNYLWVMKIGSHLCFIGLKVETVTQYKCKAVRKGGGCKWQKLTATS